MVTITGELIQSGASDVGGWTAQQFKLLGLKYPQPHGWKRRVIGTQITIDAAEQFLRLKNTSKAMQAKISGTTPPENRNMSQKNRRKQAEHDAAHWKQEAEYWEKKYRTLLDEMQESRMDQELSDITR